jgi:Rad3-related DNA helicase
MSSPASSDDAAPADAEADASARGWHYTVSVRSLCEFSARHGDLDRRFTPSATALEGQWGQQLVAARRAPDYETELALQGRWGPLRVRGRADGYDPQRHCLEEVKAIRGPADAVAENRRALHWAQLQTYGALFCRERDASGLTLALVYFDVATRTETRVQQDCSAQQLEQAFEQRCRPFVDWARQEAAHRRARDAALAALAFPLPAFRTGQRELAEAVYRAATRGRCLLAQAPTGIGKTLGTLFPLLRAMPAQAIDKIAYLTCKGTGRPVALQALHGLRAGMPGRPLRVLAMVAKEQACEHPDKACHGDACALARGFHDRLPAARAAAVAEGWLDAEAQRRIALAHGICPYHLGQELVRWSDVLVGDVHHAFDTSGVLWGLMQALDWRVALLVDEAHNLVERTRRMYSAALSTAELRAARQLAPAPLHAALDALLHATTELAAEADAPQAVLATLPDPFLQALDDASAALADHFQRDALAVGPLLQFHFSLQRLVRLLDELDAHSLVDLQQGGAADTQAGALPTPDLFGSAPAELTLTLRNLVPARFLRPRFNALHSATLFSATLAPPEHAIRLLGLPEDTAWIDLPPAFDPAHLCVQVAQGVSTRYAHRSRSLAALVDLIARQFDAHPGNYLAFFSSFDYLEQAAALLQQRRPDLPQWRQDRRMDATARSSFLGRFQPGGQGVGFAVLGGVFAEGVDLPGSRLIGAFIATLALPPVSPLQDQIRARLDALFGAGQGHADLVPAMHKVVQAAGRVLRTPDDRGWLWLLDDRYRRAEVQRLLPAWWGLAPA